MPTFNGAYIKEPVDFKVVTTEPELINALDDPENPVIPVNVDTFVELAADYPAVYASVVETGNEIIRDAEQMVEAYSQVQNYGIPLLIQNGEPDPMAKSIAVRLAWISMRQRRHIITTDQAELERDRITRGELRDIARGVLVLTALRVAAAGPAMAANIYAVTSAERVFSREKLDGL
jgi:hypothetical protein